MEQCEGAAANARTLGFYQIENELHGDGCVGCAAALSQHLQPGSDRIGMGGGDHMPVRKGERVISATGQILGLG